MQTNPILLVLLSLIPFRTPSSRNYLLMIKMTTHATCALSLVIIDPLQDTHLKKRMLTSLLALQTNSSSTYPCSCFTQVLLAVSHAHLCKLLPAPMQTSGSR